MYSGNKLVYYYKWSKTNIGLTQKEIFTTIPIPHY